MPRELHYIGRQDHEPIDDERHFYVCPSCGQAVDKRDPGAVVRHEARGHQPSPHNAPSVPGADAPVPPSPA